MTTLSLPEIRDTVEEMLAVFERDENRFYVLIDITHQLHAELTEAMAADNDD